MGDATTPPEDAGAAAARRERVIGRVSGALREVGRERTRARRRAQWGFGLAAAAAIALAVGVGWRMRGAQTTAAAVDTASSAHVAQSSGTVLLVHGGATSVVPSSAADALVASGDEVVTTPGASARVALSSGAVVEVSPASHVSLAFAIPAGAAHDDRVTLTAGSATAHVPNLAARESFVLVTPDAQIVGGGGGFTVSLLPEGASPRTHVTAVEGSVLVRFRGQEIRLAAGEQWPAAPAAAQLAPTATAASGSSSSTVPAVSAPSTSAPSNRVSSLAEQNSLMQAALAARRGGDNATAVAKIDELLAKYPATPHGEEAHVERFRALDRMGNHSAAAAEARLYLAAYPNGFARDEAKSIVLR
jgi:hypothetical protein